MFICRDRLKGMLSAQEGMPDIKVLAGVRRCGKSRLLSISGSNRVNIEHSTVIRPPPAPALAYRAGVPVCMSCVGEFVVVLVFECVAQGVAVVDAFL